jgi:hypothetical protein
MTKVSRREAVLSLLVGSSSLLIGACKAPIFKDQLPIPPERCVWIEIPYGFACIDLQALTERVSLEAGGVLPSSATIFPGRSDTLFNLSGLNKPLRFQRKSQ